MDQQRPLHPLGQSAGRPDHVIKPGESVSIHFDTPGNYSYICTFHTKDMKGTVIVAS